MASPKRALPKLFLLIFIRVLSLLLAPTLVIPQVVHHNTATLSRKDTVCAGSRLATFGWFELPAPKTVRGSLLKQAMEILNVTDVDRSVANVMEFIAQQEMIKAEMKMEAKLTRAEAEMNSIKAEMQMNLTVAEILIAQLEGEKLRLLEEKLRSEARFGAILCSRFLVELGLRKWGKTQGGGSLTGLYKKFKTLHLLVQTKKGLELSPAAKHCYQLMQQFTNCRAETDVCSELNDLPHEMSKPFHYQVLSDFDGTGFLCGGADPFATAVAISICMLQQNHSLDENITFIDSTFTQRAVLSSGLPYPLPS